MCSECEKVLTQYCCDSGLGLSNVQSRVRGNKFYFFHNKCTKESKLPIPYKTYKEKKEEQHTIFTPRFKAKEPSKGKYSYNFKKKCVGNQSKVGRKR